MFGHILSEFSSSAVLLTDLDGTLVEEGGVINFIAAVEAYKILGRDLSYEEARKKYHENSFLKTGIHEQDWFLQMSDGRDDNEKLAFAHALKGVFPEAMDSVRKANLTPPVLLSGAKQFLREVVMKLSSEKIALVTTTPKILAEYILESLGLSDSFGVILGGESMWKDGVYYPKNDFHIWNEALTKLGHRKCTIIIAEDGVEGTGFGFQHHMIDIVISLNPDSTDLPKKNSSKVFTVSNTGNWESLRRVYFGH